MNHPPPLRVAHVSLGLSTGGQEKLLVEFARHGDRERFDLTFVSLTDRGAQAETLEAAGGRVLCLNFPGGLRPSLITKLKRLFEQEHFDVVHTHDDRPLIYGVPAARWAKVGCIVHTQHHGELPGTSWRSNLLIRWSARLADAFITVSEDSARYYRSKKVPTQLVRTLWNGIDLSRFHYQGPRVGGPVVTVARLSPEKDIANLLLAAEIIVKSDPSFRLEIAGDGPLREELVRLCHERKLGQIVKFLGEVRDIPALLERASLFVLPSRSEGISLTLLEAMARGLPVVATQVGGNPEVVISGQTGLLVPSRDPAALAGAVLQMRSNFDDALLMGRAGRRRVEDHFDIRAMIARYERLYLDLRSRHRTTENRERGMVSG